LYFAFRPWVMRRAHPEPRPELPTLAGILPLILGYGTVMASYYLDIGMAYVALPSAEFGSYSASSVFPKMVLTGMMPIMLMLFPLMVGERTAVPLAVVRRIGWVLTGLSLVAMAVLFAAAPILCAGRWGIRYCEPGSYDLMLLSLVPLTLLRLLVFVTF